MEKTILTTEEKRKARIAQLEAKLQKAKAQDREAEKKAEAKTYIPTGKKVLETLKAVGYERSPDVAAELAPRMVAVGGLLLDIFKDLAPAERSAWIAKAESMKKGVAAEVLKAAQAQFEGQEKQKGESDKTGPQW